MRQCTTADDIEDSMGVAEERTARHQMITAIANMRFPHDGSVMQPPSHPSPLMNLCRGLLLPGQAFDHRTRRRTS
jgi:hypothetical protein